MSRSFKTCKRSSGNFSTRDIVRKYGTDLTDSTLQTKVSAMESTLISLDTEHPDVAKHLAAEIAAREEASELRIELERYQKTFGSELSADSQRLADRLRELERTIEQLRLQQQQESAVRLMILFLCTDL